MKNMLLVIPLLIGGCASENSSPKAILMDLIEQKNPVAIDWVNSFSGSGAKFKWHYQTDEYKSLNKLNEACNIWFENSSPDIKSTLITALEDDARGAALPEIANTLETLSTDADITKYMDYFTASYTFFVNPSYKTKQHFMNTGISDSAREDARKVTKKNASNENFIACSMFSPLFGAIGYEGFAKDTYNRMANVISTKNRRELLEKVPDF